MEFQRGRQIDHLHLRVKYLEASKRFYRAALAALRDYAWVNLSERDAPAFMDLLRRRGSGWRTASIS
jgi:catechol 2,3-dioxygenase-like lactoylglutathione lyase family enzyme